MTDEELHDQPPDPEDLEALAKWEPPAKPGSLVGLLPNKWIRRLVMGAIPLLAICFGSGLIVASQLAVNHALQVFGTAEGGKTTTVKQLRAGKVRAELVSGRPNALRLGIWTRRFKRYERHFRARVELRGYQQKPLTLYQGFSGPGHALDANFVLPKLRPGFYKLAVRALCSDETFTTTLPVRVVAETSRRRAQPTDPPKPGTTPVLTPPGPDGVLFEILPPAGPKIASELTEHITVRATDESGQPVQTQFEIRLKSGLLAKARPGVRVAGPVKTDVLGLYDFEVYSRRLSVTLEGVYKTHGGPPATNTFSFAQRTAHAAIMPDKLIARPGEEISVSVQTKERSGYIYIEGIAGGRRFATMTKSVSRAHARVTIVAPTQPGLFRIQATDDFANPGKGIASRSLFVDAGGAKDRQVLVRLARAVRAQLDADDKRTRAHLDALLGRNLLTHEQVKIDRTAAYLLSRLDHLHCPTSWLADTSVRDAAQLRKRRRRLQTFMIIGLAFTVLLLMAVVLPMIYTNILLHRQGAAERDALMAEFEGEVAEGGFRESWRDEDHDWPDEAAQTPEQKALRAAQKQKIARVQYVVQITAVTGVIVLAVAMILILLLNLTWSADL